MWVEIGLYYGNFRKKVLLVFDQTNIWGLLGENLRKITRLIDFEEARCYKIVEWKRGSGEME